MGLLFKDSLSKNNKYQFKPRDISISNGDKNIFQQKGVLIPPEWSDTAATIVASKYLYGPLDSPYREVSVEQLLNRIVLTIREWGTKDGYFYSEEDAANFSAELFHILYYQMAAFNSPVNFNLGTPRKQQVSACYINSIEDSMESILDLVKIEGLIFKGGSGAGLNISSLRGSMEGLSSGGVSSGPISFMKGFDSFAGAIKSGGTTRRAARIVVLDDNHPDILDFVTCKVTEEEKARKLISLGYTGGIEGEAYSTVAYQNANHSVRLSKELISAAENNEDWHLIARTTGEIITTIKASSIMNAISEAIYSCGDPGILFKDNINKFDTCPKDGEIVSTNPCGELVWKNETSCNLSSINLIKFLKESDDRNKFNFDIDKFNHVIDILITAQDILVHNADYPTERILEKTKEYRPLGLGFTNLGGILMKVGIPYDSDEGRYIAGNIAASMTGRAYRQSAAIARELGSFPAFERNKNSFIGVIDKHLNHCKKFGLDPEPLIEAKKNIISYGVRNAQVTLLAPCGTIGFLMDSVTTAVEPEISLKKYKSLIGGGYIESINPYVEDALKVLLDVPEQKIKEYLDLIKEDGHLENSDLDETILKVFDCSYKAPGGTRYISWRGHVDMLEVLQGVLSGGISKTISLPSDFSVRDIQEVIFTSYKKGIKAISIYRDGSKIQPVITKGKGNSKGKEAMTSNSTITQRKHLPDERSSITHKFSVGGHTGYLTVGLYEDGMPGEIFVSMSKAGSSISGLMDSFALATSIALQHGAPVQLLIDKFSHMSFEPSGFTSNGEIPMAKSIIDYIFRWMDKKFLHSNQEKTPDKKPQDSGMICQECGGIMELKGTCMYCTSCGTSTGCS